MSGTLELGDEELQLRSNSPAIVLLQTTCAPFYSKNSSNKKNQIVKYRASADFKH